MKTFNFGKIGMVALLAAALLTPLGPTPAMAAAEGKSLTIMVWGATWNVGVKDVAKKFEEQYGVPVKAVMQSGSSEGLAKLMAAKGKPGVDVWFCDAAMPSTAPPGLIADIDPAKITNRDELVAGALAKKYVAQLYYPQGIIYRKDLCPMPIKNWEDLWKPEFKKQIAVPPPAFDQGTFLVVAAKINGGDETNIQPGFDKIKQLMPNIVTFYDNDSTSRKLLAQGEVSVLIGNTGSLDYLTEAGIPAAVVNPKPTPISFDVMTVINNGNEDLAHKFIDMMVTKWAQEISVLPHKCAPVNKTVDASAIFTNDFPSPQDSLVIDHAAVKDNLGKWIEQWDKEFVK
ncbi:MAG: extracellular solute-binding protein [Pseudomonadota bacterium]